MADQKDDEKAEIEVNLEDASAPEAETAEEKQELSPDAAIQELKQQLEAEKRLRQQAERRAEEGFRTAQSAESETHKANLNLINGAITTVKREMEILRQNKIAALSSQDHQAVADIDIHISDAMNRLQQLNLGKEALESQPQQPYVKMPPPIDPVEQFASQLSQRSAEWIRRHPEYVTDPRKNQKMLAAHYAALGEGIAPDTDDYFRYVEDSLTPARVKAEPESPMSAASAPAARKAPPPAAPVSRSGTGKTTRLTRDEVEMAAMMGQTPEEYAKNKAALQREGKLN